MGNQNDSSDCSPRETVEGGSVDSADLVVVERQPRHLRGTYSMYAMHVCMYVQSPAK